MRMQNEINDANAYSSNVKYQEMIHKKNRWLYNPQIKDRYPFRHMQIVKCYHQNVGTPIFPSTNDFPALFHAVSTAE